MREFFPEKADTRKLTHAYVALALAQDVAKRDLNDSSEAKRPLISMLEIATDLLEDVLRDALPLNDPAPSLSDMCSNMLM